MKIAKHLKWSPLGDLPIHNYYSLFQEQNTLALESQPLHMQTPTKSRTTQTTMPASTHADAYHIILTLNSSLYHLSPHFPFTSFHFHLILSHLHHISLHLTEKLLTLILFYVIDCFYGQGFVETFWECLCYLLKPLWYKV